ncbi:ABC transporter ATP-binding protein [Lacrimispora brassicae]
MEPLIKATGLCVNYRTVQKAEGLRGALQSFFNRKYIEINAISEMNLQVMPGEILGLIGPNGAGKSTTLKALCGIVYPDKGTVEVAGFIPSKREKKFLKKIALVAGQRTQLWLDLPALETFRLHQLIYHIPEEQFKMHITKMIDMLDVGARVNVPVRHLSLGERLKMDLILAFIHQPQVLFLDEPTIGLDFISQNQIIEFIKEYNVNYGCGVILTSHYIKDIERLADRIQIINHGKTIITSTLSAIKAGYTPLRIVKVQIDEPYNQQLKWDKFVPEIVDPYTLVWRVEVKSTQELLATILPRLKIVDISVAETGLEEVLTQFY